MVDEIEQSLDRRLGRLPIVRKEEMLPEFWGMDTWNLVRCRSLQYSDQEGDGVDLTLLLVTASNDWIRLVFRSMSSMKMAALEPHFWLQEFEIIDVKKRGLEGISFLVQSGASDGADFRLYCNEIELVECGRGSPASS